MDLDCNGPSCSKCMTSHEVHLNWPTVGFVCRTTHSSRTHSNTEPESPSGCSNRSRVHDNTPRVVAKSCIQEQKKESSACTQAFVQR